MSVPATDNTYDVIVIGAGPVGEILAERVAAGGLSVVAVEHQLVGGSCAYWACVPSKTMLRPVVALADARRVNGARQPVSGPVDPQAVFARRDEQVADWSDDAQMEYMKGVGAAVVRGHGRLAGPRRVEVKTPDGGSVMLTARHAVAICTGSRPNVPDLPGVAEARPWTHREAMEAHTVPSRLAIIGGGAVGVEMAAMWHGLGSTVTLLAGRHGLLPRMEPFAGEMIARAYAEAGIDVRSGTTATALSRPDGSGPVTLTLEGEGELVADEVLFATGRKPLTDDIGLEVVGLEPGSWLEVDDSCAVRAVGESWLYALGDVNAHALLTHQGKYQARIAGSVISARAAGQPVDTTPWGPHAVTADHKAVAQVLFSDPQAGAVGMTAAQAQKAGRRVKVVDVAMGEVVEGAWLYADGYTGQARMVVDEDTRCLLGVTMVGPGTAELLHSATVAVAAEVPVDRLWHAVPCFPSISEVWLRLLEAYRGRS
jgi:dihydrolipoamide dehydrogenase